MRVRGELVEGRFLRRLNRFAAEIDLEGTVVVVHVPNSGRMRELLLPGARVLVLAKGGPRKTAWDLLMVWHGPVLVSIDSRIPPYLVQEAFLTGRLDGFSGFDLVRREVGLGRSRIDLALEGDGGVCFLETKSVTLVEGGCGRFPDAPTTRGTRHLLELRAAAERGHRAVVAFVIQREDATAFSPRDESDPLFAQTLREVADLVEPLAFRCRVSPGAIELSESVPVVL